ncbi:hypothetical protein [Wolbachia endosymbiont (group A) of Rhinocyllus conicus]|nr:hypothetical protein [Wolbachia endosymbiont (group A) of Rhinocyllus conicus]
MQPYQFSIRSATFHTQQISLQANFPGSQWALLHSNRKNLVATDKIHYK